MPTAAQLLVPTHPLHAVFTKSLGGKEPTKRQARKFLAKLVAQSPRFFEARLG